ncbi:hypothetical protein ABT282_07880 [Streptomyces sp. NPDC000927]|uniref:hypothetical protein n=1 Tax=Streptomyces sp. NPDC000927 TaxID=3154371 RepID=UPI00332742D3
MDDGKFHQAALAEQRHMLYDLDPGYAVRIDGCFDPVPLPGEHPSRPTPDSAETS